MSMEFLSLIVPMLFRGLKITMQIAIIGILLGFVLVSQITGERFIIDSVLAGIIVITLNAGAFISAIVKGALEGVDIGQIEAGYALGITRGKVLTHIIIPPAFKSMIPGLFNQFIISVKDTALLSIISVNDITRQTQNYVARTYNTLPAYTACAVFYLLLLSLLMILQKVVENAIKK